uniref:hypothetical protein n=1 Tax=Candidatus Electronema sp. TaxID=2698783 RepID=UPI0040575696
MSANKTVTANYAWPKVLTVRSSGAFWVPISADPSQYSGRTDYRRNVRSNTSIMLTAPEKARRWWFDWRTFSSWRGCDETNAETRICTVNMSSNKRVTAVYR